MKSKILSTILISMFLMTAMLFASFAIFANSALADPQIQVSSIVNPSPISPGTDGYVQLTFTNTGTSAASSIQIISVTADPALNVSYNPVANLGSLGTSQSTTALVRFTVSSSASSGLYNIRFQVNYCTSSCNEVDPTAIVTVQSSSSLQVESIQPSMLAAGQTATLNFNLVNEGNNPINNIIMAWSTPNNEILPLGTSNRQFIGSLSGGASMSIPINVSVGASVSPGVYPLSIQLSYFDKSGIKQNFSSSIGMQIGNSLAVNRKHRGKSSNKRLGQHPSAERLHNHRSDKHFSRKFECRRFQHCELPDRVSHFCSACIQKPEFCHFNSNTSRKRNCS